MRLNSLVLGSLAALGLLAVSGSQASAQHVRNRSVVVTQSTFVGGGFHPVYAAPVYRPVFVQPVVVSPFVGYGVPFGGVGYSRGFYPGVGFGGFGGFSPGVGIGYTSFSRNGAFSVGFGRGW